MDVDARSIAADPGPAGLVGRQGPGPADGQQIERTTRASADAEADTVLRLVPQHSQGVRPSVADCGHAAATAWRRPRVAFSGSPAIIADCVLPSRAC